MIYCFGSINLDIFYRVDHIPLPGETIAAQDRSIGLGGKGANQSVALAKAGVPVRHIGAVGSDGAELLRQISDFGVDISCLLYTSPSPRDATLSRMPSSA